MNTEEDLNSELLTDDNVISGDLLNDNVSNIDQTDNMVNDADVNAESLSGDFNNGFNE